MGIQDTIKALTHTKSLEQSGEVEKLFYGNVYRCMYISGTSLNDDSLLYRIYSVFARSSVAFFVLHELWYLFAHSPTVNAALTNINNTMINIFAVYRYWHMKSNIDIFFEITKSTKSLNFDVKTRGRKLLLKKWAKTNNVYFNLLFCLATCTVAIWYVEPLCKTGEYNLIVDMQFVYDYKTPTLYPITYFMVAIWFTYMAIFVMVNNLIMQTHLIHINFQFSILANCFENIMDDCGLLEQSDKLMSGGNSGIYTDRVLTRFNSLVKQHNHLFNITKKLQKVISLPMLGQLVTSTMLICFAGFALAKAYNTNIVVFLTCLLYMGYTMFELYIFCRWCNEITVQSLNIRNSVYSCRWERYLPPSLRAQLQFVIARASTPLVLTAGGIFDLSLATYSNILQKSYSGLTVLLQVQNIRS